MTRYLLYLGRWQLSTPTLAITIAMLGPGLWQTIVANLIGGAFFFWVDRWIFRANHPAIPDSSEPSMRVTRGVTVRFRERGEGERVKAVRDAEAELARTGGLLTSPPIPTGKSPGAFISSEEPLARTHSKRLP